MFFLLDFSADSMYLRINTKGKQLEFYDAGSGVHIQESSRLKDMKWESEHSVCTWNVQGVWSPCEDGFDVMTIDCDVHNNPSSLICCGSNDGRLRLYRYPCVSNQAHFIEYAAHDGPLGYTRFLPGGSHLVSTGLEDQAIMIWKHSVGKDLAEGDLGTQRYSNTNTFHSDLCIPSQMDENLHELSHCESDYEQVVELAHIHGYQSMCQGTSAFYHARGEVIYPVSNVIVCFDRRQGESRFMPHESVVTSICTSSAKDVVASACGIAHPKLKLWDTSTGTEITSLQIIRHQCKVCCLVFSCDSTRLACITRDEKQSHAIFVFVTLIGNWTDAFLQYHALAGHQRIYFSVFATHDDSSMDYLVTGGVSHLNFWTQDQANLIPSNRSIEDIYVSGLSVGGNSIVTGTTKGTLVYWTNRQQSKAVEAHNGSVLALCLCPEGIVSAGSDGVVIIWDIENWQKVVSYEIQSDPSDSPYRRAICSLDVFPSLNEETSTKILVGTRSSDIVEISCTTTTTTKVLDNHLFGQVQDASPNNHGEFATVDMDKSIKIWDSDHQVLRGAHVSDLPLLCIDWKDEKILVGCDTQSQKNAPYTVSGPISILV